jgi:hypothetical protein
MAYQRPSLPDIQHWTHSCPSSPSPSPPLPATSPIDDHPLPSPSPLHSLQPIPSPNTIPSGNKRARSILFDSRYAYPTLSDFFDPLLPVSPMIDGPSAVGNTYVIFPPTLFEFLCLPFDFPPFLLCFSCFSLCLIVLSLLCQICLLCLNYTPPGYPLLSHLPLLPTLHHLQSCPRVMKRGVIGRRLMQLMLKSAHSSLSQRRSA